MTSSYRILLALLAALLLATTGCDEETAPVEPERYPGTAAGIFEAYWNGVDRNYLFFSQHQLDWDAAYRNNRGRINEDMTSADLSRIMVNMSAGLRDYHFTLVTPDTVWSPSDNVLNNQPFLGFSYFTGFIPGRYLDADAVVVPEWGLVYGNITFTNSGGTPVAAVQYVHLEGFNLSSMRRQRPALLDSLLTFIQNPGPLAEGIIVDMRVNFGGSLDDLHLLAGSLLPGNPKVADVRQRIGNNRTEYGPWVPVNVFSAPRTNTLPCVVLTDRFSISMAEITTMALAQRENVTVIGTRTLGAQGPRFDGYYDREIGGSFDLPLGWLVVMAEFQTRNVDGNIYESVGFPPDVFAPLNVDLLVDDGFDNQLNEGLNRLIGIELPTAVGQAAPPAAGAMRLAKTVPGTFQPTVSLPAPEVLTGAAGQARRFQPYREAALRGGFGNR